METYWERGGMKITLKGTEFHVTELERSYESFAKAVEAIERANRESEKLKKVKLNVKCISEDGKEYTITGIHSGHKNYITAEKMKCANHGFFATPEVRRAVAKLTELRLHIDAVEEFLEKFKIPRDGYSASTADSLLEELQKKHAKAVSSKLVFDENKRSEERRQRF